MTDLADFWPTADASRDCLRIDADSASDAVALAVHQPMRFKRRTVGGAKEFDVGDETEKDLLDEFMVRDPADGLVIMPIIGNSGTGKSHVIRWLDLQLRYRPDAARRLVIRVSKGRSLKGVLSDILDQVHGAQYERFREQLAKAQERLQPHEAAGLLCEFMALTLSHWSANRSTEAGATKKQAEIDLLFDTYGSPNVLPALLRNNYLRKHHWERTEKDPGPIRRLIAQLFEERSRTEEDDRKDRFVEDDLIFGDQIDHGELGAEERKAIGWLVDDVARAQAVEVLNAALDGAKHRLLGLDPSVNDLFREIRRELLKDKQELVLLIEDFAVLSGLQGALLQVIILDSFKGDEQVLCTMRTALAYTRGYMDTDTVLTRARREYYIPDETTDETSTLQRIESLVAAYLNASRVGLPRLRHAFEDAVRTRGAEAIAKRDWVPSMEGPAKAKDAASLQAFGASANGTPLFPFNDRAVRGFALDGCQRNGKLVYNPRLVISNVLLRVLDHRQAFRDGAFPSERLGERRPEPELTHWVARNVPQEQQQRTLAMLAYWGYELKNTTQLSALDPLLASTFGVTWKLDHRPITPTAPPPKPPSGGPTQPPPPIVTAPQGPREVARAGWIEAFTSWRDGTKLPQDEARAVRTRVATAVANSLDWDVRLQKRQKTSGFTPDKQLANVIWLSNASTNPPQNESSLVIVSDEDFKDEFRSAELQDELLAVMLHHESEDRGGGTWNYDGAEEDAARYSAFVDRVAPLAAKWLEARPLRLSAAWDPIPTLVRGLLIGARALQISGAATRDHAQLIQALFDVGPVVVPSAEDTDWRSTCAKLSALRVERKTNSELPPWQEILGALVGARQGGGSIHALDASRIKPALEAALDAADLVIDWPSMGATDAAVPANKALLHAKDLVAVSKVAKAEQIRLRKWLDDVRAKLGDSIEKDQKAKLIEVARALVTEAKATLLVSDEEATKTRDQVKRFDKAAVIEVLDGTEKALEAKSQADLLSALAGDFDATRRVVSDFCEKLAALQDGIEEQLEKREQSVITQLDDALHGLHDELGGLRSVFEGWALEAKESGHDPD